eukprot:jgi/Mesvir1/27824/Mv07502-RA.1
MDNCERYDAPSAYGASILAKYGWERGKGLGVNEDGIRTHLKVKKKVDNAGIGATANRYKWDSMWWERAYNAAASNLEIGGSSGPSDKAIKEPPEQRSSDPAAADRRANVVGNTAALLAKNAPLAFQQEAKPTMPAENGARSSRDKRSPSPPEDGMRAGLGARRLADESGAVLASKSVPAVDDAWHAPRGLGFGGPANADDTSRGKPARGDADAPSAEDRDDGDERQTRPRANKKKKRAADSASDPEPLSGAANEARRVLYSSGSFVRSHVLLPDGSSKSVVPAAITSTGSSKMREDDGGTRGQSTLGESNFSRSAHDGGMTLGSGSKGNQALLRGPITPHTHFDVDEDAEGELISRDAELALGAELAKYEWGRWGGKRGKMARVARMEQEMLARMGGRGEGALGGAAGRTHGHSHSHQHGNGHGLGHGSSHSHAHGHGHGNASHPAPGHGHGVAHGHGDVNGHGHGHGHHLGHYNHVHGQFYPAGNHHAVGGGSHSAGERKKDGGGVGLERDGGRQCDEEEEEENEEEEGAGGAGERSKKKRKKVAESSGDEPLGEKKKKKKKKRKKAEEGDLDQGGWGGDGAGQQDGDMEEKTQRRKKKKKERREAGVGAVAAEKVEAKCTRLRDGEECKNRKGGDAGDSQNEGDPEDYTSKDATRRKKEKKNEEEEKKKKKKKKTKGEKGKKEEERQKVEDEEASLGEGDAKEGKEKKKKKKKQSKE